MSKILDATCDAAGNVKVGGLLVPDAIIMSEGKKASSGLLLIDGHRPRYFPSSATDIKDLIAAVVGIVDQLTIIATGLDAVTTSPGSVAAAITQLGVLKTQLQQSGEALK